ncbi:MAG: dipeptidase [Bacteroidota bacterium]
MLRTFIFLFTCIQFIACTPKVAEELNSSIDSKTTIDETTSKKILTDDALKVQAQELAQRFLITDGHVDLPYILKIKNFRLEKEFLGIPIETDKGDFDYVRAKKGGLDVPFMSVYIPASYQKKGGAKHFADSTINMIDGIIEAHPDKFGKCHSTAEAIANTKNGLVSLPMGMENGAGIEDDIQNVAHFYKKGIRYITLTHSLDNLICDSSYDTTRTWNGLSPFGRDVVEEMNNVGIMVDISHVSDSTFYQVMKLTKAPCIASHSSCRKFTPDFERNMSDDMIRALAENGGVIQINFGSTFLSGEIRENFDKTRAEILSKVEAAGLEIRSDEGQAMIDSLRKEAKGLFADVELAFQHIDHVVKLVGPDHVGFGSDFDGVGDSLPTGLKDVSKYPNLLYLMLKNGYSHEDIEKICSGNVMRVWRAVEAYASKN